MPLDTGRGFRRCCQGQHLLVQLPQVCHQLVQLALAEPSGHVGVHAASRSTRRGLWTATAGHHPQEPQRCPCHHRWTSAPSCPQGPCFQRPVTSPSPGFGHSPESGPGQPWPGRSPQKCCIAEIWQMHGATFVHLFMAGTRTGVSNVMPFSTLSSLSLQQPRHTCVGGPAGQGGKL